MIQEQIEQLTQRRSNLTEEFQGREIEFHAEIERIDQAILKFEEGIEILDGQEVTVLQEKPAKSVTQVIVEILSEVGEPLHVKRITERLHNLGHDSNESTVSRTLQVYAKKKKKFKKIAPATFTILKKKSKAAKGRSSG
jgi:hypothetical protein